jgi:hypothetical protein
MFELMMNGANSEIALERLEHGLDLRELNVAFPEDLRVVCRYIGSQQVVTVTQLGLVELLTIQFETECLAGNRLVFGRQAELDVSRGPARLIEVCQKHAQNPSYNNAGLQ